MKSERRHELGTNELADWLANFPEWWEQNGRTVGIVAVVVIVIAAVAYFAFVRTAAEERRQGEELNQLLAGFEAYKTQMARSPEARAQLGSQMVLLASQFRTFAETAENPNAAAFALITSAEVIRSSSHYAVGTDPEAETKDLKSAGEACLRAIGKVKDNPSLLASAKLQLGLCQESLGQFDDAKKTYKEVVDDPAFKGDVAISQAQMRLALMDGYKNPVFLAPAPVEKPAATIPPAPGASAIPPTIARPAPAVQPATPAPVAAGPNAPAPAK
jgi:hypothetical protein